MTLPTTHRARLGAHLDDVFRWAPEAPITRRGAAFSAIAMVVPMLIGFAANHPALGMLLGLGSMLMAGEAPGKAAQQDAHPIADSILPVVLAVGASIALARVPWHDAAMVALVTAAATLVNYSRPAAMMGIRFNILFVLNLGMATGDHSGGGAALMFGMGALWRLGLRIAAHVRSRGVPKEAPAAPARTPTPAQRRIHWKRVMRTLQGWQYPLRLGGGLALAVTVRDLWPAHHFGWVVLTIALLTPRQLEHLPVQITQRALGTVAGVLLTGAILHVAASHIALAIIACLLGIVAPLLRAGNYAAYCAVSTPVILLAMDMGQPIGAMMLGDRLVATLGGSAIVIGLNLAMDAALRWRAPKAA